MTSSTLPDIFPEQADAGEQFTREEEAAALVKAFFAIVQDWQLSSEEARALLGNPGKSRYYDLRKGLERAVHSVSEDELDRLTYISGIYYGLRILFSPANAENWLRNTADERDGYTRPWGATAPLAHMLSGKMEALIDVYRYVHGLRGGM